MAIEAEALRDALRLALRIVDRAAGEGLMFLASKQRMPAVEAADICHAVADALGIVPGGDDYMALIGDGPLPDLIHRSALAEDTARAAEGEIPEGWKLVPVEPTEAMLNAPLPPNSSITTARYESRRDLRPLIYRTLIDAAPALPFAKEAAR